jgi:hypothetical protein
MGGATRREPIKIEINNACLYSLELGGLGNGYCIVLELWHFGHGMCRLNTQFQFSKLLYVGTYCWICLSY